MKRTAFGMVAAISILATPSPAEAAVPTTPEGPAYCYTTGQWLPFPDSQGYCPDGQAPFNGPGPSYGGGNHRWPGGRDE